MTTAAIASLPRGCGTRVRGAAYWECGLDPNGAKIEEFLIDCPSLIPSGLLVSPRGVTTIEVGDVTHVVDWVGSEHYLNVSDFVAEVSRLGLSRRLPSTLDFGKITPASRILLIHARARVENASLYGPLHCPKGFHDPGSDACIGAWWQDVEGGVPVPSPRDPWLVRRRMPAFTYHARCRPEGVEPRHVPGFFASFPASRIAVVKGGDGRALVAALKAGVPVAEVDE
jgi:hypothetical protein